MRRTDDSDFALDADESQGQTLFEYVEVFKRRWIVIFAAIVLVTIAGTLYNKSRRKQYSSSSSLVVSTSKGGGDTSQASGQGVLASIEALNQARNVETQAAILGSADLLREAYNNLTPREQIDGFSDHNIPQWSYEIEQKRGIDIITVRTSAYTPRLAAKLADSIVNTYLVWDQRRNSRSVHEGRVFVEEEKDKIREQLVSATKVLANYGKKTGLVEPVQQIADQAKMLAEAEAELEKTQVEALAQKRAADNAAVQIKRLQPDVQLSVVTATNPDFDQTRARISVIQGTLAQQQQLFQDSAPEITNLKADLKVEEAHLRQLSKTLVSSVTRVRNPELDKLFQIYGEALANSIVSGEKVKGLTEYVQHWKEQFKGVPEKGRQFAELKEAVDTLLRTYDLLSDRYYALLIEEKQSIPNGFIVATAISPRSASYPNTFRGFALSLFLGILTGILAAVALERLDTRIHDPAVVERITGLTVLTSVPETKRTADQPITALTIGGGDTSSGFTESFRLLRYNIAFSSPDKELKILAVTSAGKGDGKSTTAVNLAIALALDGNRVILIDGDLRRPALHNYLAVSREVGFTNVVRGLISFKDAVLPTQYENVFCLPTGPLPPNPSEFLNSQLARDIIAEGAREYDYVIVDCPPCTGLSDVQVISTLVQGVVLVVAIDTTERQYLVGAIRLLKLASAPLVGVVLNRVRYNRSSYYAYYSYYYYYGYYQEDEEDKGKKGRRNGRRK
jgi:capsular exopolysaccharide synthesis family protein